MRAIGFIELVVLVFILLFLLLPIVAVVLAIRYFGRQSKEEYRHELERQFARQQELLDQRLLAMEERYRTASPPAPVATGESKAVQPKISEDKLMVLGAVLACHFGKRVKIRTARIVTVGGGANVWSQQGRAAVQASHSVSR